LVVKEAHFCLLCKNSPAGLHLYIKIADFYIIDTKLQSFSNYQANVETFTIGDKYPIENIDAKVDEPLLQWNSASCHPVLPHWEVSKFLHISVKKI